MRKLIIALLTATAPVIAIPSAAFFAPAFAATVSELGDLGALSAIAVDTLTIAGTGDLSAAQKRITDFEAAWDHAAGSMQPLNPTKWHAVDVAADLAIESLRAGSPVQTDVEAALTGLVAQLNDPVAGAMPATMGGAAAVAGAAAIAAFAVTNADGSPLPCEVALKKLRDASSTKPTDQAKFDELMNKGVDRCKADDDKRADGFFADAHALLG